MNLNDFIKKYTGVKCGNTDGNFGQCTGLVNLWIANLNLKHLWGNAKDFINNASDEYDIVANEPSVYPVAGDIMVWGSSMGGGYGHVAIVVSSNKKDDSFTVFEQNNPTGHAPVENTYKNWSGVIGWLYPKVLDENMEETEDLLGNDIPTEIEEEFNLKSIKRYNKHWTYQGILEDWIKLVREHEKLGSSFNSLVATSEELTNGLKRQIKSLELDLEASEAICENQLKKINELAEYEGNYKDLLKKYDTLSKEHTQLLKDNLNLQRPTPTVSEAVQLLINAIKEVFGK